MKVTASLLTLAFASQTLGLIPNKPGPQFEQLSGQGRLLGNSFGLPSQDATYDFVIAGAGLAGSVVATRLAQAFPNMTIAVVEAGSFYEISNTNYSQIPYYSTKFVGGDPDDWQPLIDWGLVTEPLAGVNNKRIHYAQGRNIGGSSGRNQMIYHRGTNGSYQSWADHVGDDSYTFENMLPHFRKTFQFSPPNPLNLPANYTPANYSLSAWDFPGGDVHVSFPNYVQPISSFAANAYANAGFEPAKDFTSGSLMGYGSYGFTIDPTTGTRSSADQLLQSALQNTSLQIYAMSEVRNILFDSNNRATGLNITTLGKKPFTLSARKEVIISAGVWHSPQLLMVSGIGPRQTLDKYNITVRSDLQGVGQNIWDTTNVGGPIYEVNVATAGPVVAIPSLFEAAKQQYYYNGTGPLSSEGGDFWGWSKIPAALRANWTNATQAAFAKFPADWPEVETILSGTGGTLVSATSTRNLISIGNSLTATTSRGNMTIASADNSVPPVINPNWLLDRADQELAVAAYRRSRQIAAGLGPVVMSEVAPGANVTTDAQILDYIRASGLAPIHHGSSSCAMGKVGNNATVVDSKARVVGVSALRVIDSSSFPFTPPGHTQGTTYGHAEKLVQDVINEYM